MALVYIDYKEKKTLDVIGLFILKQSGTGELSLVP